MVDEAAPSHSWGGAASPSCENMLGLVQRGELVLRHNSSDDGTPKKCFRDAQDVACSHLAPA